MQAGLPVSPAVCPTQAEPTTESLFCSPAPQSLWIPVVVGAPLPTGLTNFGWRNSRFVV